MPTRSTFALLIAVAVTGCAMRNPKIVVYSDPPGAEIVELGTGRDAGMSPALSVYDGGQLVKAGANAGCYLVWGYEASWPSGARATSGDPIRLCNGLRGQYNITINRNRDDPGLGMDLAWAKSLANYQRAQAAEQQRAAAAEQQRAAVAEKQAQAERNAHAVNQLMMLNAIDGFAKAAGCAAAGNCARISPTPSALTVIPSSSGPSGGAGCSSDYSCGVGNTCVKNMYSATGVCMKSVDEYGLRQYDTPDPSSVGVKTQGQCEFNTDCPVGFFCGKTSKACIKRGAR